MHKSKTVCLKRSLEESFLLESTVCSQGAEGAGQNSAHFQIQLWQIRWYWLLYHWYKNFQKKTTFLFLLVLYFTYNGESMF